MLLTVFSLFFNEKFLVSIKFSEKAPKWYWRI